MTNLLTVDLEDWFHICEVENLLPRKDWDELPSTVVADTENILGLLRQWGVRGTFFVLGYVAERHPQLIEKIHSLGHEIGYHGWDHELVYDLTPREFRRILQRGVKKIEALINKRPIGFRAPQWSINDRSPWAIEILSDEGFVYDSSRVPLRFIGNPSYRWHLHRMETCAGTVWEVPPLTLRTPFGRYPAGGGWGLRCLPYPMVNREVRRLNSMGMPALFYFHPREFGSNRTVDRLPPAKRFAVNAGIWSSRDRLAKLLSAFEFTSVEHLLLHK